MKKSDRFLIFISRLSCTFLLITFLGLIIVLYTFAHVSFKKFGLNFIFGQSWNPAKEKFSAFSAIIGTLITSLIAITIAVPVSLAISILVTNILPKKISSCATLMIQFFTGIPSIIFGMWGLFILVPFFSLHIEPALSASMGHLPIIGRLFYGTPMGIGTLTAGFILAIMITPLITNMLINLFRKVPTHLTESGYICGATRWEVVTQIQLPHLKSGILGSIILGLGRALGETIAVGFVIGNSHTLSSSLLMPGCTIASTIANEFTEATGSLYTSSLIGLAFILMIITLATIIIARSLLKRGNK